MDIQYGSYDTNKANVVTAPNGKSILAFPRNMNPFKVMRMECFRNESNQVVISLMENNSTMYEPHEWETLLKTPSLQSAHENKMDEVLSQAADALRHFLEQSKEQATHFPKCGKCNVEIRENRSALAVDGIQTCRECFDKASPYFGFLGRIFR